MIPIEGYRLLTVLFFDHCNHPNKQITMFAMYTCRVSWAVSHKLYRQWETRSGLPVSGFDDDTGRGRKSPAMWGVRFHVTRPVVDF